MELSGLTEERDPERIRKSALHSMKAVCRDLAQCAHKMLSSDLNDPTLNAPDSHPDEYMLRANQIAIGLIQAECPMAAVYLYKALIERTSRYCDATGRTRHLGAMYANIGGAYWVQGNVDDTLLWLVRAAADDVEKYRIADYRDSYAMTDLLDKYVREPGQKAALATVWEVEPGASKDDIDALCQQLGIQREYILYAYLDLAEKHLKARKDSPNEFSDMQVMSALRNLAVLLETHLKTLAGDMGVHFFEAAARLFKAQPWWRRFDRELNEVRHGAANPKSSSIEKSYDEQLESAITLDPADDAQKFVKSLIVAYVARNYLMHQVDTQCLLVQSYAEQVLSHVLHVMIVAATYAGPSCLGDRRGK